MSTAPKKLVNFFDEGDPNSLVNMVPQSMKVAMLQVNPKFLKTEEKLLRSWCKPTETEEKLRLAFWDEYFRAKDDKKTFDLKNVTEGVCSREYWYKYILPRPHKVAWVIIPPPEYSLTMRSMHNLSIARMKEILDLPIKNRLGEPNVKLIGEMVKIFALMDNRVKGAVIQRMQVLQKSENIHMHTTVPEKVKSVSDIEREINQIDNQISQLKAPINSVMDEDAINELRDIDAKELASEYNQSDTDS